jgi:hypothetical protein
MHCWFRTGLSGCLFWQRLGFRFRCGRFRRQNIQRNSGWGRCRLRGRRDCISQSHAAFEHRCQYSHAGANPEDTPSIAKGRTGHRRGHDETFLSRPIAPECHSSMPAHFMFLECQNENTGAETFPLKTSPPNWFPRFFAFIKLQTMQPRIRASYKIVPNRLRPLSFGVRTISRQCVPAAPPLRQLS